MVDPSIKHFRVKTITAKFYSSYARARAHTHTAHTHTHTHSTHTAHTHTQITHTHKHARRHAHGEKLEYAASVYVLSVSAFRKQRKETVNPRVSRAKIML